MTAAPLNILLICSDQHQAKAVGSAGHACVQTPNLDRLAQSGTSCRQAYCNSPICGPSRISFMTGRYLHELGMWCNGVPWNGKARTWAGQLGELGYQTVSRGKMDVPGPCTNVQFQDFLEYLPRPAYAPWPLTQCRPYDRPDYRGDGFADWANAGRSREDLLHEHGLNPDRLYLTDEAGAYRTGYFDHDRITIDGAIAALRQLDRRRPWVMHVGLLQPHWPFVCPQEFLDRYPPAALELPVDFRRPNESLHPTLRHYQRTQNDYRAIRDETHLRRILAAYYGMITAMDQMVGELLDELDRLHLAENTCVIYTSDHGEALGEHGLFDKLTPYEASLAVPLIIRGPGLPAGRELSTPVSLVDLYPTLLDLAGAAPESSLPGRSLLPLIDGQSEAPPRGILSEYHGIFLRDSWCLWRRGDWKYVHYTGQRPTLFNPAEDPHELRDRAADPEQQPRCRELAAELRRRIDPDAVAARAARELAKDRF